MPKKYRVTLTIEERERLTALVTKGKAAARALTHARILLKTDEAEEGPASGETGERGLGVAGAAKPDEVPHDLAVHHRRCPYSPGSPLPLVRGLTEY